MSARQNKPPAYAPVNVEIGNPTDEVEVDARERTSHAPADGPSFKQWVVIVATCIVGGYWLASILFKPAKVTLDVNMHFDSTDSHAVVPLETMSTTTDLVAQPKMDGELLVLDKRVNLNPFATFHAGNAGVKVGLIVGGVSTFNTGVSNCDQGHYASCVTGIISGLLLTAAGLWAPVPARRDLGVKFDNLTIPFDQHDPLSDHPAHRFISNYNDVVARNPSFSGARIASVQYARTAAHRHRLVIIPKSSGIGRRQDNSDNDGGSVSYEWTDFGPNADGADTNKADYDNVAGGVAGYLQDNQANSICLTQCLGYSIYEGGQLQTQAGTDPAYDTDCEFSDDMDGC